MTRKRIDKCMNPFGMNTDDITFQASRVDIIGDVKYSGFCKCYTPKNQFAMRIGTGCYRIISEKIVY